jgi:hypothetical protein
MMNARLTRPLLRFLRDERGTVLTEFVIIFPILVWAWVGMFYYWDIYRAENMAQKASFTVADGLSRSNGELTPQYVTGMADLLTYLSGADNEVRMRLTSVKWNKATQKHEVSWSYSPYSKMTVLTNNDIASKASQLPTLVEFETVLLLETEIDYVPPIGMTKIGPLDLGVGERTISEFIVTKPRFVTPICLTTKACS